MTCRCFAFRSLSRPRHSPRQGLADPSLQQRLSATLYRKKEESIVVGGGTHSSEREKKREMKSEKEKNEKKKTHFFSLLDLNLVHSFFLSLSSDRHSPSPFSLFFPKSIYSYSLIPNTANEKKIISRLFC